MEGHLLARLRPTAVAVGALALTLGLSAGCKNPQCWTGGGASEGPECQGSPSYSSGPSYDPASYRRNAERQLAEYQPRCVAGEAVACWMAGAAQEELGRPTAEIEASYAAGCHGGLGVIPGDSSGVCGKAGQFAKQPGGSGAEAAREFYQLGCERGASSDCRELFVLWPSLTLDLAVRACQLWVGEACERAATMAAAGGEPALARALTVRGCHLGVEELCATLGRQAVTP